METSINAFLMGLIYFLEIMASVLDNCDDFSGCRKYLYLMVV